MKGETFAAFDLGSSNVRLFLAHWEGGQLQLHHEASFFHEPIRKENRLVWDYEGIEQFVLTSLAQVGQRKEVKLVSLGIDSWGVDFVVVGKQGERLGLPFSYRDEKVADEADTFLNDYFSKKELFLRTGISCMDINTLFQLFSCSQRRGLLQKGEGKLLLTADYFIHFLTGEQLTEYSLASTSQMLTLDGVWDREFVSLLGLNKKSLPEVVQHGRQHFPLLPSIVQRVGLTDTRVTVSLAHDTAAAAFSLPLTEDDCFLSTGSWGILGTVSNKPILTEEGYEAEISNERLDASTFLPLMNLAGLWLLQELYRDFGGRYTYEELVDSAYQEYACNGYGKIKLSDALIDPILPEFAEMGNVREKINLYLQKRGKRLLRTPAEFTRTILDSLLAYYAEKLKIYEKIVGKQFKAVYLTGGATKSPYFGNILSALTGKTVYGEGVESAIAGNIFSQYHCFHPEIPLDEVRHSISSYRTIY